MVRSRDARLILGLLACLTVMRLAAAAVTPLSPDEAYYWIWSRHLQWGYPDHPPMVALWIRIGTALLGRSALGVRLLAPLAACGGSVFLLLAARDLCRHPRAGLVAVTLLNATLMLGAGAVIMTPDTPLLFFWCVGLWTLGRLFATGRPAWWLAFGAAAGLGMDSKYTAALLPLSAGLWLAMDRKRLRSLLTIHPYLAALAAFLIFFPVLAWNASHDWVSFVRQGGRASDWRPARALQFLGELLGGQIGLATPAIFMLFAWGAWRAVRAWRQPHAALLAALILVPSAVFTQHAIGDRVQANWPCVLYPALALAAAEATARWRLVAVSGYAVTALVTVQAATGLLPLPRGLDPSLVQLGGWRGWAEAAETERRRSGASYLASEAYGEASLLAWYLPQVPIVAVDPRWRWFDQPDAGRWTEARNGLLVSRGGSDLIRRRGSQVAASYHLCLLHDQYVDGIILTTY